ncbi:hypothetical protein MPSEU_001058200 [Mayamaea pseudoterrestris]|nr:hypothetical protein MPSEU_001058200 [Mayamaea pseudoterrestris]
MRLLSLLAFFASTFTTTDASLVDFERRTRDGSGFQGQLLAEHSRGQRKSQNFVHRALKGSKGYSSGNRRAKGGSKGSQGKPLKTKKMTFFVKKSEIRSNVIQNADGYTAMFPLYQQGRQVGLWYESVVYTLANDRDGFGSVAITFNKNSILSLSTVSTNNVYPVTGGSGSFKKCVSGAAQVTDDKPSIITFEINLIQAC